MLLRSFAPSCAAFFAAALANLCPARAADEGAEEAALRLKADDLAALMEFHADQSRFPEAAAKGRDAFRYYMALGDARTAARVIARAGSLNLSGQRFNDARQDLDSALRVQEQIGDVVGACFTRQILARLCMKGPRPSEAVPFLEAAFSDAVKHDLRGAIMLLGRVSADLRGRMIESTPAPAAYFDLCVKEADFWLAARWPFNAQKVLHERIAVLSRDGRSAEAAAACAELVAHFLMNRDRYGEASARHNLGLLLSGRAAEDDSAFAVADEAFEKAQKARRETGDDVGLAWSLNNRGFMRLSRKMFAQARPFFEEANTLFSMHRYHEGNAVVLSNLVALARAENDEKALKSFEFALEMARKSRPPEPVRMEFSPAKSDRAYYLFLRADDRSPIVELRGERDELVFTLAYTGEEMRVPVTPEQKEIKIIFKSPVSLRGDSAVASCTFRISGNRAVTYGEIFVFLAEGVRAVADREGNLYIGDVSLESPQDVSDPGGPNSYSSLDTPSAALKTAIESFNRNDWDTFCDSVSWFAIRWIPRESFDSTAARRRDLPVKIRVTGHSARNPSWVELRYRYEADWAAVPALSGPGPAADSIRKELEARFASEFGENRHTAFMVKEGRHWKLDFLGRE